MKVKVNENEYSFDGYAHPINSIQKLADECYQQGKADALEEMPKCKNCIHWKSLNLTADNHHICYVHNWMSLDDDYCSLVEVKGEKNE